MQEEVLDMRVILSNLRVFAPLIIISLLVLPGWSQDVESLGVNPETGFEGIRVNIPGLPEGAKPLDMILIQPGTFTMGCPSDERGRHSEEWFSHEVTLTQGFYLGMYEVTQAQWEAVMGSKPTDGHAASIYGVGDDHPVFIVSWNECQTFVEYLNGMGIGVFRLPTEAEWEYACRAGTETRFSFGDALECSDSSSYCTLMDEYMWWDGNDNNQSEEVGSKLPNPWGLYDMHGNLSEWCSDWWEDPSSRGPQVDPQGPSSGLGRVIRGGNWAGDASYNRSASRYSDTPYTHSAGFGFRLLRESESESTVESFTQYRSR